MTQAQKKLAAKHGTPLANQTNLWKDYQLGILTLREATAENMKYRRLWSEAGQVSRDLEAEIESTEPEF